jgi:hypothetical protein
VNPSPADRALVEALPFAALRVKLRSEHRAEGPAAIFWQTYGNDPVAFIRDCFIWRPGEAPTAYQEEILGALPIERRVCVRTPHGGGKTTLVSLAVLWFSLTRDIAGLDWKVPMTASAWRQLSHFLLPEIRKWSRRLRWDKLGRPPLDTRSELLALSLKLATGEAFAVASDEPALIEGAHADHLLYILDESKAIPSATFDAVEGAFANGEALALAVSTPGEPSGRFYDIQARRPGYEDWKTYHVTLEETIAAGRVSRDWAEQRQRQWGETSAVYQNRVLGEFASSDEDGVIPLAWVEAANERWRDWDEVGRPGPFTCVGVDVARSGEDKTVFALRFGSVIGELRRFARADTMQTSGRVAGILAGHGGRAMIDVIGLGAGVVDRLREQGLAVEGFNASERTDATDRSGELGFVNKRSAAWWQLREMLDPANGENIALPPDDLLTGDLVAAHWRVVSGGKIQIESKETIKGRLGRSTDDGDAVVMAFADEADQEVVWIPDESEYRVQISPF